VCSLRRGGAHISLSRFRIVTAFMQGSAGGLAFSSLSVGYVLTELRETQKDGGFHTTPNYRAVLTGVCQALLTDIVLVRGPYIAIYTAIPGSLHDPPAGQWAQHRNDPVASSICDGSMITSASFTSLNDFQYPFTIVFNYFTQLNHCLFFEIYYQQTEFLLIIAQDAFLRLAMVAVCDINAHRSGSISLSIDYYLLRELSSAMLLLWGVCDCFTLQSSIGKEVLSGTKSSVGFLIPKTNVFFPQRCSHGSCHH
jgi:hypothetical protein